ncbi:DUF4864 domain-containing protein [Legionella sp. km772]|uniref:DUF4864 domain-containing protein n=1 Tax=Legionella sp. km772 TaxID=2498111 RepID=UPI000F8E4871|nr:DUF4864 domain-containing protein [Legionella sp. km772]RUR04542.1 DUF4864 domain-containing protein [Legionella sp. km772]
MTVMHNCPSCGAKLKDDDSQFCPKCGAKIPEKVLLDPNNINEVESRKSGRQALLLCIFFGPLGIHRFYVGKFFTGMLTLLTGGFLGIWTILDLIRINQNKFTDKEGNTLIVAHNVSSLHKIILTLGSIGFWLIITISVLLTFISYLTSGLLNTANEQLEALRAGNINEAYSYTSQEYQQAISLANFQKWLAENPELKNNKSANFTQRGITNSPVNNAAGYLNSGFLEGTITTNDGKKIGIKYIFLKENDRWKIVGIFLER